MTLRIDAARVGLRGAPLLVDADAMRSVLASTLFRDDAAPLTVRPTYLRLKPGTALHVAYEVLVDRPGTDLVRVHASAGDGSLVAREQAKWRSLHPSIEARARCYAFDGENDLVVARLPFDVELRELDEVLLPSRIKRLCERIDDPFGADRSAAVRERGSAAQILSYRPRRRAVVRWALRVREAAGFAGRRVVARLSDAPARSGAAWRRDGDCPGFPRVLAEALGGRLLIEEDLGGAPAAELDRVAAGALVARFHRLTRERIAEFGAAAVSWGDELGRAEAAARDVAALAPETAPAAQRALAALRSLETPGIASDTTGLHGDLHCGQIVTREDGSLALCDLDRAEPGAAARDVARLAADWILRTGRPVDACEDLLRGYGAEGGRAFGLSELTPFLALVLVQAAGEPLRRFQPDAAAASQRRLDLALELLRPRSVREAAR